MLCEHCHQKPATIHMSQFINGVKTETHLCQDCSAHGEATLSIESLFNGLLGSLLMVKESQQNTRHTPCKPCATCGMTYDAFRTAGKFGCAGCYAVFAKELEAIFKNVQGSTRHEGKFPQLNGQPMFHQREVDRLRHVLRTAIEEENYENAARLRDQIRTIEAALAAENTEG